MYPILCGFFFVIAFIYYFIVNEIFVYSIIMKMGEPKTECELERLAFNTKLTMRSQMTVFEIPLKIIVYNVTVSSCSLLTFL